MRPQATPLPEDLMFLIEPPAANPFKEFAEPALARQDDVETDPSEKALGLVWGRWDEPLSPPEYLVQGLIPVETVGIFVAKGSSLKTWAALSIGADVAAGTPWLNTYATKKTPVIVVDYESGRWQIASRMALLGRTKSPDLAHANFPDQRIDSEDFWKTLARVVQRKGVGLVIIDSFAAGAAGADENEASAVTVTMQLAGKFSEGLKCAVLFIHHAKKGEGGDERDIARGSSAIYAGCDWMYKFDPLNEERTKMLVSCNKPWGPKPTDFRIELTTVDGLKLCTEDTEAREELEGQIKTALAAKDRASLLDLNRALGKKSGYVKESDLAALIVRREIVKLPGRGYVLDFPEARQRRIVAATAIPGMSTPEKLAKAADVQADEILAMLKAGALFKSGTGYVSAVPIPVPLLLEEESGDRKDATFNDPP